MITFDICASAKIFKHLFPDEKWELFLTKNINGLTEGYDPIPINSDCSEIFYELDDLRNFAIQYGSENRIHSSEVINTTINMHVKSIGLLHKLDELNMTVCALEKTRDFVSAKKIKEDGTVDLTLESFTNWMVAITEITSRFHLTCWTLATFADELNNHSLGKNISVKKAAELSEMAINEAVKICDSADQIQWIID